MGQIVFFGKELKPGQTGVWDKRRALHLFLDKGMNRIKTGIYKLHIGDRYYIGRAVNIRTRAKQHMKDMEYMIHYKKEKGNGQKNMLKHLLDNPSIDRFRIEILEECPQSQLQEREQFWIDRHIEDSGMLNTRTVATRTAKDAAIEAYNPGIYLIKVKVETLTEYMELKKLKRLYNVISINPENG